MDSREVSRIEQLSLCLTVQEQAMKIKEKYMKHEISAKEAYKLINVYEAFADKCRVDGYHILIDQMENYLRSVKEAIAIREKQLTEGFSK